MRAYLFISLFPLLLLIGCSGNTKHPNPSGTLEATEVEISAELSARILEVRYDIGTTVKMGDTLIVLDMRLIQLQKAQTEASRGSIIAQQQVANDAIQQAQESFKLAEATLKRTESLLEQGSNPTQLSINWNL
jgi:multidrug resistance efflux pump